tara:strand:+ start:1566 stop:1742 length:177 start_codon:yes stop_codon:yes gene_type:complete
MLGELLLEFSESKPKESDKYIKALNEMYFYANSMHIENRELELALSQMRYETNKKIFI